MIYKCFSVYDKKVGVYGMPFFAINSVDAYRSFETLAMDDKTNVGRWPTDFDLVFLGDFDNATGTLIPPDTGIQNLVNANTLVVANKDKALSKPVE